MIGLIIALQMGIRRLCVQGDSSSSNKSKEDLHSKKLPKWLINLRSRSLSNLPQIFGSDMFLELQQHADALATPTSKVGILREAAI